MDDKNKKAIEIYDAVAEDYSQAYDSIDGEDDLIFPDAFLSQVKPGSFVVDLGCGTGFTAGYFTEKGMEVEGSDLSSGMIAIAKRNYPALKFSVADMREFRPNKEADAVWAGYSMFHFEQPELEKTIETVKAYLKPQGVFALVVQEGEGEIEVPEPFLPDQKIYIHLYTEADLRAILEWHGFEVVDQKRKAPMHASEFPYNKLLLIARRK